MILEKNGKFSIPSLHQNRRLDPVRVSAPTKQQNKQPTKQAVIILATVLSKLLWQFLVQIISVSLGAAINLLGWPLILLIILFAVIAGS